MSEGEHALWLHAVTRWKLSRTAGSVECAEWPGYWRGGGRHTQLAGTKGGRGKCYFYLTPCFSLVQCYKLITQGVTEVSSTPESWCTERTLSVLWIHQHISLSTHRLYFCNSAVQTQYLEKVALHNAKMVMGHGFYCEGPFPSLPRSCFSPFVSNPNMEQASSVLLLPSEDFPASVRWAGGNTTFQRQQ